MKIIKNNKQVNKDIISKVIKDSWAEIDRLSKFIEVLRQDDFDNSAVEDALQSIIDAYLICAGQLEPLASTEVSDLGTIDFEFDPANNEFQDKPELDVQAIQPDDQSINQVAQPIEEPVSVEDGLNNPNILPRDHFEKFEYFVDFDEPIGDALTDEDLYPSE